MGSAAHSAGSGRFGACVGRNELHGNVRPKERSTKKGKENFRGDINLLLNTISYLLYGGSLAKRLTFKSADDITLPGSLEDAFALMCAGIEHKSLPSSFLTSGGLFGTVASQQL